MQGLTLLVAVDDGRASRAALQFLAPLVATGAVQLTLVSRNADPERAAALLASAVERLGNPPGVQQRVTPGRLEQVLVREAKAQGVEVVVLTPPPRTVWRRWLRTTLVLRVARRLPTSLLMIRGRHRVAPLQRALIAGGGGPAMLADAALAARLLAPVGGTATVCHVVSQLPARVGVRAGEAGWRAAVLGAGTPEAGRLQATVAVLGQAGVRAEVKVRLGLVVDEVVAEAQTGNYELLVIGAHQATSRLERFLLEDISSELLRKSPVPVLVVRTGDAPGAAGERGATAE